MIHKLCKANVSEPVVMILTFIFDQTYVWVLFGDYLGGDWLIGDGAEHGRVLSSLFFHSI